MLLSRCLVSWLDSELWSTDWTSMWEWFGGIFLSLLPHRQKLKILSSSKSNLLVYGGFMEIWRGGNRQTDGPLSRRMTSNLNGQSCHLIESRYPNKRSYFWSLGEGWVRSGWGLVSEACANLFIKFTSSLNRCFSFLRNILIRVLSLSLSLSLSQKKKKKKKKKTGYQRGQAYRVGRHVVRGRLFQGSTVSSDENATVWTAPVLSRCLLISPTMAHLAYLEQCSSTSANSSMKSILMGSEPGRWMTMSAPGNDWNWTNNGRISNVVYEGIGRTRILTSDATKTQMPPWLVRRLRSLEAGRGRDRSRTFVALQRWRWVIRPIRATIQQLPLGDDCLWYSCWLQPLHCRVTGHSRPDVEWSKWNFVYIDEYTSVRWRHLANERK